MFNVMHQFHKSTYLVCKNKGNKAILILTCTAKCQTVPERPFGQRDNMWRCGKQQWAEHRVSTRPLVLRSPALPLSLPPSLPPTGGGGRRATSPKGQSFMLSDAAGCQAVGKSDGTETEAARLHAGQICGPPGTNSQHGMLHRDTTGTPPSQNAPPPPPACLEKSQ